ncbi:hypothetical protein K2Q16_01665 [Patescibacteria group bacterium]|nr:hypothetical protein [Patescibacteria group bacterium]
MADTTTQPEDKKTVVAFIVGLLIGGLLVWAFSGPSAGAPTKMDDKKGEASEEAVADNTEESEAVATDEEVAAPAPALEVGDGSVALGEVAAGTSVPLSNVTYPVGEGWVGVRSYQDGRLGTILGVVRFSKEQGLVPPTIVLQTPMRAGSQYAVVMFTEDGDRSFNLAADTQIDEIFATFTAK